MMNMLNNQDQEVDSICVPLLSEIGVGINTQRFFFPFFSDDNGRLVFDFSWQGETMDKEIFGLNTHRLTCSTGVWLVGATKHVRDVFLFFSAAEALAFFHIHQHRYDFFNGCAFVAFGVKLCKEQIEFVKIVYKKARIHTVFGNDLIGRIYDCKVSLWLARKDCTFFLNKNQIVAQVINPKTGCFKKTEIERSKFSFSAFYRLNGGRSHLKTHKPEPKFNSFIDYLITKNSYNNLFI